MNAPPIKIRTVNSYFRLAKQLCRLAAACT